MTSAHKSTRELAAALRRQTVKTGAATPSVRGSDWSRAVVASVGSAGTVTTNDGIVALRAESYDAPAVGDVIRTTISSSGACVALGRYAPTDGSDAWQSLTLGSGWSNFGSTFQTARARLAPGGLVMVQGLVAQAGTISGTSNIATLPAPMRPPAGLAFPALSNGNALRQLEVTSGGVIRATQLPSGTINYLSINVQFTNF